jgi:hypothetical protein
MYGFVQLCFTLIALLVFLPTNFMYPLALLYQVSMASDSSMWYRLSGRARCALCYCSILQPLVSGIHFCYSGLPCKVCLADLPANRKYTQAGQ